MLSWLLLSSSWYVIVIVRLSSSLSWYVIVIVGSSLSWYVIVFGMWSWLLFQRPGFLSGCFCLKWTLVNTDSFSLSFVEYWFRYFSLPKEADTQHEPRLYHCYNIRGSLEVEEVYDFDQDDLISEDVMFLDTYYRLHIWFGKGARRDEMAKTIEFVQVCCFVSPLGPFDIFKIGNVCQF
jgi:hypothetical protein